MFLRDRADILKMRLKAIRSKQCGNKRNTAQCPEVFLDAVADRLTNTADFFLDAELLAKFYYLVCPREVMTLALSPSKTVADLKLVPTRA